jgi:hypothetical protein
MSYEGFTLDILSERFELRFREFDDLYADVKPVAASELLMATMQRNLPLVVNKGTEKARSELIIAPVLVEVREILNRKVAVFSGVAFNVDKKLGLHGFCDFLISQDPLLIEVQAPVMMLVEAKKEDLAGGIAQCVAEMVAAERFNLKRGKPREKIFGIVSSGTDWRFLELQGTQVRLDLRDYSIQELPAILGVLTYMAKAV